jgi:glyoxylase-like metal-dependent hydrolase (beta-lactamase superfamily II)
MRWQTYEPSQGEHWFGFSSVRNLRGLPPEIAMVPLLGHTMGHAGLAVKDNARWILLAGDAYFDQDEMHPTHPRCAPGLKAYQWLMEKDHDLRVTNQERLRQLVKNHAEEVHVICSHDPRELERDTGHTLDTPVVAAPRGDISAPYVTH